MISQLESERLARRIAEENLSTTDKGYILISWCKYERDEYIFILFFVGVFFKIVEWKLYYIFAEKTMLEVEVRQLVQRHEKELSAKDAAIQLITQKVIL